MWSLITDQTWKIGVITDHWSDLGPIKLEPWSPSKKNLRTPMIIIKKNLYMLSVIFWSMSPSKFYKLRIPPFWKSIFLSLYIVPWLQVCLKFRESISREIQFWIYELASTKFRFIEMEWSPVWEFGKELNMNLLSTFPFPIQCLALPPR